MKRITQLLAFSLFCTLIIFTACKKKKSSTKEDIRDAAGAALSKTWTVTSVTKDTEPREEWELFTIGFTYNAESDMGGYSVSNVPANEGAADVWGSGVSWSFGGTEDSPDTGVIVRSDIGNMNATTDDPTNPTTLVLTFSITDASARVAGFNGEWVFTLEAQ
ncbi:MAG: hypothetical protein JXR10_07855 [Cyclobacteriaceae bacterium]